jgi:hypothetical protein
VPGHDDSDTDVWGGGGDQGGGLFFIKFSNGIGLNLYTFSLEGGSAEEGGEGGGVDMQGGEREEGEVESKSGGMVTMRQVGFRV